MGKFIFDPLGYVYFNYPWLESAGRLANEEGPDQWQADLLVTLGEECLKAAQSEDPLPVQIAIASGHGIGKTTLISWIIQWFMSTRDLPEIIVTANTKDQLTGKTWRELKKWNDMSFNKHWFKHTATKYSAVWDTAWFAAANTWSKERSEAFAGTHEKNVMMIYDEASMIDDSIWETSSGAMTTRGSIWIVFGNPTKNTGRFRECFYGGQFEERWITKQIDSRTAKMANKRTLSQWIEDYGDDSDFVRVRVKGQFPRASTQQLISSEIVDKAMGRHIHASEYRDFPKILGVDVARYGMDSSVILKRQGKACFDMEKHPSLNNMELAARVAWIDREWHPDAIFVDAGRGEGVIDRLRQLGLSHVHEINFGSKAMDDAHYFNKRSEMWDSIRKWLETGGCIPDVPQLKTELIAADYAFDNKDRIQVERKEDMKEKIPQNLSPDHADALCLTFAMPVTALAGKSDSEFYALVNRDKQRANYDPLHRN